MGERTYYCSWPGLPGMSGSPIVATSRSKARYRYWLKLSDAWPMAKLTEIVVRSGTKVAGPQHVQEGEGR